MQRSIQRAAHGINGVHALDLLSCFFLGCQTHRDVNPADDEHAILFFYLAGHIGGELSIAGINLTRFQRASKGAHHSASRC